MRNCLAARWLLLSTLVFLPLRASSQEFQITAKPIRVGQQFIRTSEVGLNVRTVLKFAGNLIDEMDQEEYTKERRVETILATDGINVSSLKVYYEQWAETSTAVSKERGPIQEKSAKKNTVQGKTYIIKSDGDKLVITNENGMRPSQQELEELEKDYGQLGKIEPLTRFLENKQVTVGKEIRVPQWVGKDFLHDQGANIENFSITPKSIRSKGASSTAVFDIVLKMSGKAGENTSLKLNLSGEAIVDMQQGWLVSLKLEGPARVTGLDQIGSRLVVVDGVGIMTIAEATQSR